MVHFYAVNKTAGICVPALNNLTVLPYEKVNQSLHSIWVTCFNRAGMPGLFNFFWEKTAVAFTTFVVLPGVAACQSAGEQGEASQWAQAAPGSRLFDLNNGGRAGHYRR